MIGREYRHCLVVQDANNNVVEVFDLGRATLEEGEFDRIGECAKKKGLNLHLIEQFEECNVQDILDELGNWLDKDQYLTED